MTSPNTIEKKPKFDLMPREGADFGSGVEPSNLETDQDPESVKIPLQTAITERVGEIEAEKAPLVDPELLEQARKAASPETGGSIPSRKMLAEMLNILQGNKKVSPYTDLNMALGITDTSEKPSSN